MPTRVSSSQFVGRQAELTRLEEIWKAATTEDRAATVLIAGEAGVGKSRLLAELGAHIEEPALTLVGGCMLVVDQALPFGPIVQILRALHRAVDDATLDAIVGPARTELGALMPELHAERPESVEAAALFEQLLGMFERLAERVPTLLVVEDMHWADASTRELFAFLARNLSVAPIVLVGTYRSDDLHRRHPLRTVAAELERAGVERIELKRFDRDEVRELITAILGHEPDPELVDQTFERSDGNAFFAEELLAAGNSSAATLPPTLRDILLSRIDALGDDTQEVLRSASIIGRSIDHRLLAAATDLPEPALTDATREAVAQHILLSDGDALSYRFRHALVREVVEDELLPGERVALHTRVAELLADHPEWFAGCPAELAAELACHWDSSRNGPRALTAALHAAREAEQIYAYSEALAHVERVLALWSQVPDAEVRTGMRHVDAMRYAALQAELDGSTDRALDYVRAALKEIDPREDPVTAGLLHDRWSRLSWMLGGVWSEILEHCYEAVRLVPDEATSERAKVLATLGQQAMLAGRHDEAIAACEDAIRVAQLVGEPVIEGHARNSLGAVFAASGRTEEGLEQLHRARDLAERTGSWGDVARAAVNEGGVLQTLTRHEEALALSLEGAAQARDHGLDRTFGSFLRLNASESLWTLGRWSEFEEQLREIEVIDPVGYDRWRAAHQRCLLAIAQCRFDAARAYAARVAELIRATGDVHDHLAFERLTIGLAAWEGEPERGLEIALDALSQPIDDATMCTDVSLEVVREALAAGATAVLRARDELTRDQLLAGVRQIATECEQWSEGDRWGGGRPGDFDATLALVAAEVARAEGNDTAAQWSAVAARWAGYHEAPREAYAYWRAAEAAVRDGDRDGAQRAASTSYETAERIGWIGVRDAVAQLARRARLDVDVPDDVAPSAAERYGLTARELDVLALVAQGRTNRQIADELFISAKTASVHVSNILGKLDAANRGEAAAAARRLGLD